MELRGPASKPSSPHTRFLTFWDTLDFSLVLSLGVNPHSCHSEEGPRMAGPSSFRSGEASFYPRMTSLKISHPHFQRGKPGPHWRASLQPRPALVSQQSDLLPPHRPAPQDPATPWLKPLCHPAEALASGKRSGDSTGTKTPLQPQLGG